MLLFVDNQDSFTYNLVELFRRTGQEVCVCSSDALTVGDALGLEPNGLIIGPGPGRPAEAGISLALIEAALGYLPVLGVCLGHQALAEIMGAKVHRAKQPIHGKVSTILHTEEGLFRGIKQGLSVMRYHSLIVDGTRLMEPLHCVAQTAEGEVMAIQHRTLPAFGLQFHPESVLSQQGEVIIRNFLNYL
jgi:anthranilate synthase component 2